MATKVTYFLRFGSPCAVVMFSLAELIAPDGQTRYRIYFPSVCSRSSQLGKQGWNRHTGDWHPFNRLTVKIWSSKVTFLGLVMKMFEYVYILPLPFGQKVSGAKWCWMPNACLQPVRTRQRWSSGVNQWRGDKIFHGVLDGLSSKHFLIMTPSSKYLETPMLTSKIGMFIT